MDKSHLVEIYKIEAEKYNNHEHLRPVHPSLKITALTVFFFVSTSSMGQMSFSSFTQVKLGNSYKSDASLRKKSIKQAYRLEYCKEQDTYTLQFDKVPVEDYGDADVTFSYYQNTLVEVELAFGADCDGYAMINGIYNQLAKGIKQKYKALPEIAVESGYDLRNKNVYDSLRLFKQNFQQRKFIGYDNLGYDDYRLSKQLFPDNRTISFQVLANTWERKTFQPSGYGLRENSDTICEHYLIVSVYNSASLEVVRSTPGDCKSLSIIETRDNTIRLRNEGHVFVLTARLNDVLENQDFIFDTGASDVTITPDVFLVLYKAGTIKDSDYIGSKTYQLADGSFIKSSRFILHEMKIDGIVLTDVEVSISNSTQAPMLFGQSGITKLGNYKIDFDNNLLILER